MYGKNRFQYIDELRRMGANITVDGRIAVIEGVFVLGAGVKPGCKKIL